MQKTFSEKLDRAWEKLQDKNYKNTLADIILDFKNEAAGIAISDTAANVKTLAERLKEAKEATPLSEYQSGYANALIYAESLFTKEQPKYVFAVKYNGKPNLQEWRVKLVEHLVKKYNYSNSDACEYASLPHWELFYNQNYTPEYAANAEHSNIIF